jgi:hypothetical protein
MKKIVTFVFVSLLFCLPAMAQVKPCEELKSEIDAKIRKNGAENYTLEIVPADQTGNRTVVGSCNGGQDKIIYTRGGQGN